MSTLTNAYATVEELQGALATSGVTVDAAWYELLIGAASDMVSRHCNRSFVVPTVATTRWFKADDDGDYVVVDDIASTTDLVVAYDAEGDGDTDGTVVAAGYMLDPVNGITSAGEACPYTGIRFRPGYRVFSLDDVPEVRVTARFGWPAVPRNVRLATVLQAVQLAKSPDAPFGVAGAADFGVLRIQAKLHPTAAALLDGYERQRMGV